MSTQIYEDYWEITNAYTNYNGKKFRTTLKICIEYIDAYHCEEQSEEKYERLQQRLNEKLPKNLASIRKSINQLVKMGFINSFLVSYNPGAKEYIKAKTNRKRQSILSKVVYSYSSFSSSYEKKSDYNHVNFILKTLIEVGSLSKEDIKGLMTVNIHNHDKGYLVRSEINRYVHLADAGAFDERKFNQIGYLWNLLKKLDDLIVVNKKLYLRDDAKVIFGSDLRQEGRKRDDYLHRVYKNLLIEESDNRFNNITKCMIEKLAYPSLVASHIKPFADSELHEAYDSNNGLLLSRNIDILFDQGYISFKNNGKIIYSKELQSDVKSYLDNYNLDSKFINKARSKYLKYHRKNIFKKAS